MCKNRKKMMALCSILKGVINLKLIPKALNVAMCSHMFSGCSGWGWSTMASTSYRRQRHGISDGFTTTVNRYWLLPRFICRERHRKVQVLLQAPSKFNMYFLLPKNRRLNCPVTFQVYPSCLMMSRNFMARLT